jgi:hypothetical protein
VLSDAQRKLIKDWAEAEADRLDSDTNAAAK